MGRFGIFVDAGYLYAASGKLLFGLTDRRRLILNADAMVGALHSKGGRRLPTGTPPHVLV